MSEEEKEAAPKKKSDLIPRLITAVTAGPLLLWVLLGGPAWAFAIVVVAAAAIGAWEYMTIVTNREARFAQAVTALTGGGLAAAMFWTGTTETGPNVHLVLGILAFGMIGAFIAHLFTFKDQQKASTFVGGSAVALLYASLLPAFMGLLRRDAGLDGGWWVFMCMAVVWGSDTGAYFSGRAFGKHKLAPKVSPKKSIEGAVGGLVSSIVAVIVFKFTALPDLTWIDVFLLAIPANILGQIGDLCESLIKRAHGVKDSGVIIYGHGGLLDRIDALIFAVPWFYVYFMFILGKI